MSIAEKLKLIAENVQKVYEAGKAAGGGSGDGWYDEFWDEYQRNPTTGELGGKTDYRYMFYGSGWTNTTFKPKYNMAPTNASSMFYSADIKGDFAELLESLGVELDLSNCSSHSAIFNSADLITRLPELDMSKGDFSYSFGGMRRLQKIDKLIINDLGNQSWASAFTNDYKLEDLIIEGVIGKNGFNVQWCPLNHDSIVSIINALSTSTSGLSITLNKSSVNNAFGINVDDDTTYPEGSEYYNLRHSKDNWTINYI